MIRVNYTINGYEKLLLGELVKEDSTFIVVMARDGILFTINRNTINEIREVKNSSSGSKEVRV
jgi:beta-xylosidase